MQNTLFYTFKLQITSLDSPRQEIFGQLNSSATSWQMFLKRTRGLFPQLLYSDWEYVAPPIKTVKLKAIALEIRWDKKDWIGIFKLICCTACKGLLPLPLPHGSDCNDKRISSVARSCYFNLNIPDCRTHPLITSAILTRLSANPYSFLSLFRENYASLPLLLSYLVLSQLFPFLPLFSNHLSFFL